MTGWLNGWRGLAAAAALMMTVGRVAAADGAGVDTVVPAGPATTCQVVIGGGSNTGDGVAFQPGVDVHGDPVAPADLPGAVRVDIPSFGAAAAQGGEPAIGVPFGVGPDTGMSGPSAATNGGTVKPTAGGTTTGGTTGGGGPGGRGRPGYGGDRLLAAGIALDAATACARALQRPAGD